MPRSYKTEGIILKRTNFGEADKILTIYTKHYGKIKILAKGVRRITSRKGGNVELFNQVVIFAAQGKNLDLLAEVQVINSFKTWRKDLAKVSVAYYGCELVDRLTPEGQVHREVYEFLVDYLKKISHEDRLKLTRSLEEKLLEALGFGVPEELKRRSDSLKAYIEEITERKINSKPDFLE